MFKAFISIVLALALAPAVAQVNDLDPGRFAPETSAVIARLVREASTPQVETEGKLVAQQTTRCKKLGGTPKAPVCGGTCSNGGQCDIAFSGTSAYCACQ